MNTKPEPYEMFKVLSVDKRVRIIELLKSEGPLGAKKIAELLDITPAAVSQHLRILRHSGLVKSARKGYWIPHSIDEKALENCREILSEVCTCGCKDTGKEREREMADAPLESLKTYEKELQDEITMIRERIRAIEDKKM